MKENTYISVTDWMIDALGSTRECMLYALMYSYAQADDTDTIRMQRSYMCARLHSNEQQVNRALCALAQKGCIEVTSGCGRGCVSEFKLLLKRGQKKGVKNDTFSTEKRGQKKGVKNDTFSNNKIINNNKNNKTCTSTCTTSARGTFLGNLEQIKQSNMTDYNFDEFWQLMQVSAEYEYKKDEARRAWISCTYRDAIMMALKAGKPHRADPCYHIRYFAEKNSTSANFADHIEMLSVTEVYKRFGTTDPQGWCLLAQRADDGSARMCKYEDARAAGMKVQRICE